MGFNSGFKGLMVVSQEKKISSEDTSQCPQCGVYMIILFALESNIFVCHIVVSHSSNVDVYSLAR